MHDLAEQIPARHASVGRNPAARDHAELLEMRMRQPEKIAEVAEMRTRGTPLIGDGGQLLIIAADHPARGSIGAGDRPLAMANRRDLLERLCAALDRPGVHGVLGTADILEDLLLLGALEGKVVFGSMNRGGLAGSVFELDDRFTGYDAERIARAGFDGGKMLLRIDPRDPASVSTIHACAAAVHELADRRLIAMIEPFVSHRDNGLVRNDLSPEEVIRSIAIASGLAGTSAYTWLKVPVVDDMERITTASTLPTFLLGGNTSRDPESTYRSWECALRLPGAHGLVVGRNLLYPPDDDVAAAVDTAASLLRSPQEAQKEAIDT